ncbi:MAG: hypothetical protein ACLT08_01715 [Roseburia inulinivorans]
MDSVNEKEANTCAIILSKAALTEWNRFDPAGYRAYATFQERADKLDEAELTDLLLQGDCRGISASYAQNEQQAILLMSLNPLMLH